MNRQSKNNKYQNQKTEQFTDGAAITHEQVSDTMTEGTIDGQIDQVDENGKLISHDGEALKRGNPDGKKK
ncbi:hypothetical protein GCM10007216_36080 [Thalassobacillus devorans]|uniref:DUF4025 domain-containing protein n=1 Tax=Thalassobacillus devorans TaxID=279813 RepID=A0ABQ1PS92_9BACI|nr:YozQ family protein [Thalassobacillus devorans]NIK30536.1 hypothetical protein [Thalassobacillus devorans]GGD02153.1 hypothetical protein GCM10007216_36080 [Thalassobacillus devorans]